MTADELYAAFQATKAAYRAHFLDAAARRLPGNCGYRLFRPKDQAEFTRMVTEKKRLYQAYLDALPNRWYVVADTTDETEKERWVKERDVWTLSHDPRKPGWSTDSGCSGYGLSFEDATELADAANAAWRNRLRRPLP